MNLSHPPEGDREQAHAYVADAVRQGVALAKLDWERGLSEEALDEVDARIDRKIDKVKLWLFGVVLANLIPVVAFAYMFGQFAGQIETKLDSISGMSAVEIERRFNEAERRIGTLETYHREK